MITVHVNKLLEYWSTGEQLHVLYINLYMKYVFFSGYVQYSIILISKRKFSVLLKPVKLYTIFERPIRYGVRYKVVRYGLALAGTLAGSLAKFRPSRLKPHGGSDLHPSPAADIDHAYRAQPTYELRGRPLVNRGSP